MFLLVIQSYVAVRVGDTTVGVAWLVGVLVLLYMILGKTARVERSE